MLGTLPANSIKPHSVNYKGDKMIVEMGIPVYDPLKMKWTFRKQKCKFSDEIEITKTTILVAKYIYEVYKNGEKFE